MKKVFHQLIAVVIFAVVMAYLESVIVVYLRHIYGISDLLSDLPTKPDQFTIIEIGRELCTLVMLAAIGWIAGHKWQDRIGYAVMAFGVWDIFYYFWLVVFIGWPTSIFEWDILFLIPFPWWGPVLTPILIASLMIIWGLITIIKSHQNFSIHYKILDLGVLFLSILLALYCFTEDAISVLPGGVEAISKVRPETFNWVLYFLSISGMSFFIFRSARQKTEKIQ